MTMLLLQSALLVICTIVIVLQTHRIMQLRAAARNRIVMLPVAHGSSRDIDPGPLSDAALRSFLRLGWPIPSKIHDRVQDAFERILRERRAP